MNDKELIELAAKAAGIALVPCGCSKGTFKAVHAKDYATHWNPLADDGDALRLAVRLQLGIEMQFDSVVVFIRSRACVVETHYRQDVEAATRRAITRAAAEIGRNM